MAARVMIVIVVINGKNSNENNNRNDRSRVVIVLIVLMVTIFGRLILTCLLCALQLEPLSNSIAIKVT